MGTSSNTVLLQQIYNIPSFNPPQSLVCLHKHLSWKGQHLYQNQQTHGWSTAGWFHSRSHSSGTASLMISTIHLIATATWCTSFCFILLPLGKKKKNNQTQDASCNSASGKETAGIWVGGEEFHLTAQCPATARGLDIPEVSMARKLQGNSHVVCYQFSPALCQRTSPFLPCGDGVRCPTSMVGSAHIKCIIFLSARHFILHLTQYPGLEIENDIRDHSVFFIRRNSSLSRKILQSWFLAWFHARWALTHWRMQLQKLNERTAKT